MKEEADFDRIAILVHLSDIFLNFKDYTNFKLPVTKRSISLSRLKKTLSYIKDDGLLNKEALHNFKTALQKLEITKDRVQSYHLKKEVTDALNKLMEFV